jgi:hypothetical protein
MVNICYFTVYNYAYFIRYLGIAIVSPPENPTVKN